MNEKELENLFVDLINKVSEIVDFDYSVEFRMNGFKSPDYPDETYFHIIVKDEYDNVVFDKGADSSYNYEENTIIKLTNKYFI